MALTLNSTQWSHFSRSSSAAPRTRRTIEEILRIRGAMWTVRCNLPFGPRPGQDSNILAMDYYELYPPDARKRMLERYFDEKRYTHFVTGPIFDAGGYHGWWPSQTDLSLDAWLRYLDLISEPIQQKRGIPVHFVKPDGWTFEEMRARLEPLYLHPRTQEVLGDAAIVPGGWEPVRYEWSTDTWNLFFTWAAQLFPDAAILAHSVCDVDALKGKDERRNDEPDSNGVSWQRVAPNLDGWLVQVCGFTDMPDPHDALAIELFKRNLAAYFFDLRRRFHEGYPGDWARGSRRGPNIPLRVWYGEGGSYQFFRDAAITEQLVESFGDVSMANGADGSLDGCTM
jgi:hypothetical protein